MTHKLILRMKKSLYIIVIFFLTSIFISCNDNESKTIKVIYSDEEIGLDNFEALSLRPYQIDAMVYIPDETASIGASTSTTIKHDLDSYEWLIEAGPNFRLKIEDWGDEPFEEFLTYVDDLDIYNIEYLEKDENFVVYKTTLKFKGISNDNKVGVNHESFHVAAQHTINGINYIFRTDDDGCEEKIVKYMIKSVKSIRPLKNGE